MTSSIGKSLLIIFIQFWFSAATSDDSIYLHALKDGWQNTPLNWEYNFDPCSGWEGIECTNSRVTTIDLSTNEGLTGSLTPEIGNLKKLKRLHLINCGFSGLLPNTLGNLENLISMSLNYNCFTGPIPSSIGNITTLYWLDLTDNKLTGDLPVSSGNSPGLDMLTNARHFHFGRNKLTGFIPPRLFSSKMSLVHLLLENNQLTGSIPSTLGLVQSLEVLRLDRNNLSGNVPSSINNLTSVLEMYLSNNKLTGRVPNLTGLRALNYLDMSNNTFSPTLVPIWFSTLQSLTTLKMFSTNLVGELPSTLFDIPQLQNVDLSDNGINGTLTIGSSQSNQLQQVNLQNNQIGIFSQRSEYSIQLILVGNPICTEPDETDRFCFPPTNNTTSYSTQPNNCVPITCSNSGQVLSPNCRCAFPYTGNLIFRAPSFSNLENSTIYESLLISLMRFFRLSLLPVDSVVLRNPFNDLDDYLVVKLQVFPFGEERFNMTGFTVLGFSFISTSGRGSKSSNTGVIIGSVVGSCVLLALLVVAGMHAFRKKRSAERATTLWDANNGSGAVPQLKGVKAFSFEKVSKYTNNFSEMNNIGTGGYGMVFPFGEERFNMTGVIGLGFSFSNQTFKPPKDFGTYFFIGEKYNFLRGRGSKSSNIGVIIGSVVGSCVLLALLVVAGMHAFRKKRSAERATSESSPFALWDANNGSGAVPQLKGVKAFSFEKVSKYTNNFSEMNNIGTGGYGMVYKGSLPNGQLIAIKRAKQGSTQGGLEFKTEIELLSRVHHKNLVRLVGFCFDQGEQMLVYDYIVNGTVRDSLSDKGKHIVREVRQSMDRSTELYNLHDILDPTIGLTTQLEGFERFVDVALRCVEETGDQRPTMSDVVKEIESIMEILGLNPHAESALNSASYDYSSKGSKHPYTNDNLFAYSTDHFSIELDAK
ncbi:leucine-rich repeat protein kinase family protein [Artemisia annua]|uniref:Leucine-rich repeat protein kinase family protein n=1 Tax=Artemisia annua TaxID=35608 RepID=A0A2U1MX78_ARTAN|nr:leucine-rich repeat protein kinase family protein [Artemisia annua]